MRHLLLWIAALSLANNVAAFSATITGCKLRPVSLSITGGDDGLTSIILHDGVELSPGGALAWNEPMQLRQRGGMSCMVTDEVSIITTPMIAAGDKILYVTAYSGSASVLFAVSVRDCRVQWKSQPFASGPILVGNQLHLIGAPDVVVGPNCLPVEPEKP